jgi:glycine oxidase
LPGGVFVPDDHSVDPLRLHAALLDLAAGRGVQRRAVAVNDVRLGPLVVSMADGSSMAAHKVVIAAGAWSAPLTERWLGLQLPVRPVKGQTVTVRGPQDTLRHVVRGSVRGNAVYLVPRSDGAVVIGATSEEAGFDVRPRAGAVHDLLRDAQALLPDVSEMELLGTSTALRPATPDNAPVIGAAVDGVIFATGHYRNGVLLAPITAEAVSAIIDGGSATEAAAFGVDRFAGVRVAS